jgi:hypothetical protein
MITATPATAPQTFSSPRVVFGGIEAATGPEGLVSLDVVTTA